MYKNDIMDKGKAIARAKALLQDASATQCDLALTFIEHMTGSAEKDMSGNGKEFTFTSPDAINIAYIVRRNQNDSQFIHKLLVRAMNLEEIKAAREVEKSHGREP